MIGMTDVSNDDDGSRTVFGKLIAYLKNCDSQSDRSQQAKPCKYFYALPNISHRQKF